MISLFYQALTGFLKPDPKCYEGSLPQPRKSPCSSLAKVSGMRKLGSPFLLSCGCWHDTCHPGQETPFLSILLLDQISPPPAHIFLSLRIQRSPTQSGGEWVAWWHDKTEWLVRPRPPPGHRKVARDFIWDNTGSPAPSNPHPPITHHNLVIINKLNQTEQKYRQIFLSFP